MRITFYMIDGRTLVDVDDVLAAMRESIEGPAAPVFCDRFEMLLRRAADKAMKDERAEARA